MLLEKCDDGLWKYTSNVVCSKKNHPIWPFHVKVMPLWFWTFLENEWTISCQPHMGISSSWTFWNGEIKIFNFHVGQNSIWSLYDEVILRRKTFHFGQLKLQVTCYFWKLFVWPPILQPWSLICQMRLIWTWMRPFKPSHTFQSIKSGTVDHSWLSRISAEIQLDWWALIIQSLSQSLHNDHIITWTW